MVIEWKGRGVPLSAECSDTRVKINLNGTDIATLDTTYGLSATTVYATNLSGTTTSAGGTTFVFSAVAGKMMCGCSLGAGHPENAITGDAVLSVVWGGRTYYIPCCSAAVRET